MRIVWIEANGYLIAPRGIEIGQILQSVYANTGMREGSFADMEVRRVFTGFFRCAMNLTSCYEKYYSKEYDSFQEFLYQKEILEYPSIDTLRLQADEVIWKLRYEFNGHTVSELVEYSNENIQILNRFIEGISL